MRKRYLLPACWQRAGVVRAQQMQMPAQEPQPWNENGAGKTGISRMGKKRRKMRRARWSTLEQVQKIASESNPTLRQAQAEIRAAKARQQQSGLYPKSNHGLHGR